ncbi:MULTISPECIES: MFS transporter [Bacillus]|uniref:MFS transporter n=1 Tax=Bacillus TaxID=1386 RepID=UPI00158263B1|nr:MFS transporter [Bacillus glycinifermentans]MBU8785566.1 MFS transporter [Bacillus glycinifermentans]NUJ15886.1 MFS transporter [Bacillus glycinifermentans]
MKASPSFIMYAVCISAFFASLSQNIYSPIIPLIMDSFRVSAPMVNLSVTLFIFVTAVMQMILGPLIDRKGAGFVMTAGIAVTAAASIGCAAAQDFTLFLIFRVLQAAGTAALPLIAATTISGLFEGTKRASAMGTYQMLLSIAPAAAPILGGFIGDRYSYPGVFWFLAGISAILFLVNALYVPHRKPGKKGRITANCLFSGYKDIFKNKTGQAMFSLSFFIFFVYFSIIVYLPILLTDSYHLSLKTVGLLYLPIAGSTIAGSVLFKWIQKKAPLGRLFLYGNLTAAGSIVIFGFTHTFSIFFMSIALILFGIAMGLIPPLFSTVVANEYEENRGSALGMFNFIRYTGMACGPMITAFLLERLPSVSVFCCFGALYAGAVLVMETVIGKAYRLKTEQRQKTIGSS